MSKPIPIFFGEVKDGKFILADRVRFNSYVRSLKGEVEMILRRRRRIRSIRANAYYWGVVLDVISDATGFTSEELHQVFKRKFLGYYRSYKGKKFIFVRSTASLSSFDFWEYINKICEFASKEFQIYVPAPGEFDEPEHSIKAAG